MNDTTHVSIISKGKIVSKDNLDKYPVIVLGASLPDRETAYAFDSHDELKRWTQQTNLSTVFDIIEDKIKEVQQFKNQDNSAMEEAQRLFFKNNAELLAERAMQIGLNADSREFVMRMTVDRPVLEPPLTNSAWLWTSPGCRGRSIHIPQYFPLPDFRWLGWDNVASSSVVTPFIRGRVRHTLLLCEDRFFEGRQVYLISDVDEPRWYARFANFSFDNKASSALLI